MPDDNTTDDNIEEGQSLVQPLPQDNTTPFSDPTDPIADSAAGLGVREQQSILDPTHQATDSATNIDPHQEYDEGLAGAAEASEPNAGNSVVDYNPEDDQRRQEAA